MGEFKPTNVEALTRSVKKWSDDDVYWKRLDFPVTVKEFGGIHAIDFSPVKPYHFAVACSSKLQLYDPMSSRIVKTIGRFARHAFDVKFRADGQLLLAGSDEGFVKLFSTQSKSQLRLFKGHQSAVHCCRFFVDGRRVASCSDDHSVRCWDISSGQQLCQLDGHEDYVRCGAVGNRSDSLVITGSYDKCCHVWDTRTVAKVASVEHGAAVEAMLLFPNDALFLTAGGTVVKVWDLHAMRLLAQFSNHYKAITSMALCCENRRLLTAGLDRHIKVHDVASYGVVHTLTFPAPVLRIAISADDNALAVGMAEGLLSIQRRKPDERQKRAKPRDTAHYRYRLRKGAHVQNDFVVSQDKVASLSKYDRCLRSFEHSKALDIVLKKYYIERRPEVTASVLRELVRRGALRKALAGRDANALAPLVKFLKRYMHNQNFRRTILDCIEVLLDIYGLTLPNQPQNFVHLFEKLQKALSAAMEELLVMSETVGVMDIVMSLASAGTRGADVTEQNSALLADVKGQLVFGEVELIKDSAARIDVQ